MDTRHATTVIVLGLIMGVAVGTRIGYTQGAIEMFINVILITLAILSVVFGFHLRTLAKLGITDTSQIKGRPKDI